MKYISLFIMLMMGSLLVRSQENDLVLTGAESGNVTHQATNSITFDMGYSYTPNGGSMTAEIVEPGSETISYNQTVVDPDSRAINTSYEVGTTNGSFNVNLFGAATYTIPIELPAGVAGLQPSLSLNYSSMAGSGVVGYGWQIGGLSSINRNPQTHLHDGANVGVNLTTTDRFSLDGKRLVCTSGTYGGYGSQYRTEQDIFSKVTCYTGSYGPDRFEVKTKSGLTCQYGYNSDADRNIEGHEETVSWYMNKMTDVYGNTVNYEYMKWNGHNYIHEITYGPNTVNFYYKGRTDKNVSYLLGAKLELDLILEKIEIKYDSNVIKKYEFRYNYQGSGNDSYSFLNEVIVYGIGSSRYNSTAFTYNTPSSILLSQTVNNITNSDFYNSNLYPGDYNGDGKQDIAAINPLGTSIRLYFASGTGNFNAPITISRPPSWTFRSAEVADINGDGMDDLLLVEEYPDPYGTPYDWFSFYISTGSTLHQTYYFSKQTSIDYELPPKKEVLPLNESGSDFNGDGLSELLIMSPDDGSWELHSYLYSNNTLVNPSLISSGSISDFDEFYAKDFNGDGNTDLMVIDHTGLKIYYYEQNSFVLKRTFTQITSSKDYTFGDFNGDGKTDIFLYGYLGSSYSTWYIYQSTGTDLELHTLSQKFSDITDKELLLADFNGDGKADILAYPFTGSVTKILSSKNSGTDFNLNDVSITNTKFYSSDFDGNGKSDILSTASSAGYKFHKSEGENSYGIKRISNGLGALTKIYYSKLSSGSTVYTKGTGATFPVYDMQGAINVVSTVEFVNGIGGTSTDSYTYEGAKIHRQGRGFLCYTKQKKSNSVTQLSQENIFDYNTTLFYPRLVTQYKKYNTTYLSTTSNTWSHLTPATNLFVPYISSSTQTDNLTGLSVTKSVTLNNSNGNITKSVINYNNGYTTTTDYLYDTNTTYKWIGGRLTSSKVTHAKSGENSIVRETKYTYSTDGKLKPDFVKYLEGTSWYVYNNFDYNSQGNVVQKYDYATNGGGRQTNYTYDTDNIRVKTTTDPLGHTTTNNYDSYGRLTSTIGFLSDTTSVTYDDMNRISTETNPSKLVKTTTYNWGIATSGLPYSAYNTMVSGNDGSQVKTWFDKLGRNIRSDVKGFSGSDVYTVTEYNTKGQVYRISDPSTSTTPSQWTVNAYDSYGRIDNIDRPTIDTDYSYSTNRVTETNGSRTTWKEVSSMGLVTKAHDDGGDITYTYYPDGALKSVIAPGNIITSLEYDLAGNRTKLIDPSSGTTTDSYDGYGQLKTTTNNRGQQTSINYLADGRVNTKTMPEGTETWSYNTNKMLETISNSSTNVTRTFSYDSKGRVDQISETIPGSSALNATFAYDGVGRLQSRTHPSGILETMSYTNGYLSSVSADGVTRWAATATNAYGQVTNADYGTSLKAEFGFDSDGIPTNRIAKVGSSYRQYYKVVFDNATGNVIKRRDHYKNKEESFTYDTGLDRLLTVTGPQNLTMSYANNGNLTQKTDVSSAYTYGTSSKPYQLTEIESSAGLISSVEQNIVYTSFEQPASITESPYEAIFTYNAEGKRAKMEVKQSSATIKTRWYAGSRYIKETAGGVTKEYTWIGGDAYTAPCLAITQSGTTTYYYLLRDHLGTITRVTDASGNLVNQYNFDAWGRRRNFNDWSYSVAAQTDILPDRGFTGHEYLPWFKLYNMNGRLYDPIVGRFLEPDPAVQNTFSTQNLNRYSYCLNNPLKYTDPTGWVMNPGFNEGVWRMIEDAWEDAQNTYDDMMYTYGGGVCTGSYSLGYSGSGNTFWYSVTVGEWYRNSKGNPTKIDGNSANFLTEFYSITLPSLSENLSKNNNGVLYWSATAGSVWDMYNNFGFRYHNTYPTTKGVMKPYSDFLGRKMSKQALKMKSLSGRVKGAGNLGTGLMVLNATINIYNDEGKPIDYVDGLVGVTGLTNSALLQWSMYGSTALSQFVAIYGFARLQYDFVFVPNRDKYIDNVMNNKYPLDGVYNPTTGMYDHAIIGW
ncbi:FG-GAP-like repeat-containing protein [Draconibacterium sp.]|nr:FG-GAP-like repeat-containing protein [Draconibacterium sp.]